MAAEAQIREVLRQIPDPEIGINIVDLGLLYDLRVEAGAVRVAVTMTTPACPLHEYLTNEIDAALRAQFPEVTSVQVDLVWEPPWDPSMMSDDAKAQLGWAR